MEAELAQRELDLATLQAELRAFEARYLRVVGSRFAERDEVEARIVEAAARRRPGPLVMDAAIAAMAIEHGATLCTSDRDFARFPGLK